MAALVGAQESEDVILGLQDSDELTLTFLSRIAPNHWKELKNVFKPNDGLSEMSMEEDLHKLKFVKKEDLKNLSLAIAKITMRYRMTLPDSKKAARILRLGKLRYADVVAAKERSCCQVMKREYASRELLDCMCDTWKLCR